jgi:hypothetical protein
MRLSAWRLSCEVLKGNIDKIEAEDNNKIESGIEKLWAVLAGDVSIG